MARKLPPPEQVDPVIELAARGCAGVHPGLVVRVRPATPFERATWVSCPADGVRVCVDEDGMHTQNYELAAKLPQAAFVSLKAWQRLLKAALRGAAAR